MEVYIDDVVVKSKKVEDHVKDLEVAFKILEEFNMKLNPSKYHFGVSSGKFLGYMVTKGGIEASPKQIKAILELESPKKPELSGRMAKWSVQLSTYDISFEPRTAIKSQALADFMDEFSPSLEPDLIIEVNHLDTQKLGEEWTLHVDGATNIIGTGLGLVLKSPQRDLIAQAISCEFKATNNEAKYETLITGLKAVQKSMARLNPATKW
ncbi:uncharacterized protein LOC141601983 [Silene latifolia]|uniref:uncharacterized protein LOC141601983 n=1 Tax=Silene latifolia TaxID=37657 RepID=UPI003D77509D